MFIYKDQLVKYLTSGHIHLSKKDFGFFSNIVISIERNNQITSNQSKLVDKLITKYQRQIRRCNLDPDTLLALSWKTNLVESKDEFLQARIILQDNILTVTSPFNNNFIKHFRNIDLNPFVWNKESKKYTAEYSSYAFKIAYRSITKYFENIVIDEQLTYMLNYVNQYSNHIFDPTYVKSNDSFYISAVNEHLLNNCNIDFNDSEMTLFHLSQMGIKIHPDIIGQNEFKNFAGNYNVIIDSSRIEFLGKYLSDLGIKTVLFGRGLSYSKQLSQDIKKVLLESGIDTYLVNSKLNYENAVLINLHSHNDNNTNSNVVKVITLTNSKPIEVK